MLMENIFKLAVSLYLSIIWSSYFEYSIAMWNPNHTEEQIYFLVIGTFWKYFFPPDGWLW